MDFPVFPCFPLFSVFRGPDPEFPLFKCFSWKATKVDIPVLRSSDICDPHSSCSSASLSSCMEISLFRLQEIWLTKFVP